jgi:hypothetical protein
VAVVMVPIRRDVGVWLDLGRQGLDQVVDIRPDGDR